jgi:hypothetical protein
MSFWTKAVESAKAAAQEAVKDMNASVANKVENSSNRIRGVEAEYQTPAAGTLESFVFAKITKFNDNSSIYSGAALQGEYIQRKIQNALNSYAAGATGKLLVLLDVTSFGKGDRGLCLTENELFFAIGRLDDDSSSFKINLKDIRKIEADGADNDSPYITVNRIDLPFHNLDLRRFMKALVASIDEYRKQPK